MDFTRISDPRLSWDFVPGLFPLCDGKPAASPDTKDRQEKRKIEFAAAYYELNRCLEQRRKAIVDSDQSGADTLLEHYHGAVNYRDKLEDLYSPEGFYAEAELDGLITVNLVFHYARKRRRTKAGDGSQCFRLFIPMPPADSDVEGHVVEHLNAHDIDEWLTVPRSEN